MEKLESFLKKYWFEICIAIIIFIAIVLRFYNFENRWGLAYDQTRDVLVAHEALRTHSIPLIGPFSSAEQFVYGPQWFWVLMLMIGIYPSSFITPWIIQILLYVLMVFVMIIIGKEINGKIFGLLVGLFTAISPAQIAQSTNLTSPSMVSIFSIASVYFFVKYVKERKPLYSFLLGFFIATAVNIHFQAVGLFVLIPIIIVFSKGTKQTLLSLFLGILIPFIPLIVFDLKNNFYETRGILDYYMYGQYKIYLPNRWLTYAGVFWPNSWALIIGGYRLIGYGIIAMLSATVLFTIYKREFKKPLVSLMLGFLLMFIMLRYYRGERYDGYIIFLHPFVLLFTAWLNYRLFIYRRLLGLIFCIILVGSSLHVVILEITNATNYAASRAEAWKNTLIEKFPDKKFAIYDYGYKSAGFSLPLVLFLEHENKLSDRGYLIGFGSHPIISMRLPHPEIKENKAGFTLRDLSSSSSAELEKAGWAFVNPSAIYHSTVEWYIGKKL